MNSYFYEYTCISEPKVFAVFFTPIVVCVYNCFFMLIDRERPDGKTKMQLQ